MFYLILILFIAGYLVIALEHPLKIDKSATALVLGVLTWTIYMLFSNEILSLGFSPAWQEILHKFQLIKSNFADSDLVKSLNPEIFAHPGDTRHFIVSELEHHLIEISEILFFLLGAMTIVEIIDQHEGFSLITDRIRTLNKTKLIWIIGILTFFMSAILDNLTTTIVMVALIRKLISDKKTRWMFASLVVIAANSGGAWSPIGDVTTIMLWIGGQVTTVPIITRLFLPSLISLLVPLGILSLTMKGSVTRPGVSENEMTYTTKRERTTVLFAGVAALLFVPVFKTVTHLPPYMGMLLGLGVLWVITEIMHSSKAPEITSKLRVLNILRRIDTSTILFFLGILTAVAALQSAGHLNIMAQWLNKHLENVYAINTVIGILSAIVDNVPLVAGAMGMYDIALPGATGFEALFVQDGKFWELLAYCAGTGGSMLIIGSAAGVAAMGLEKIDFIWYLKKISLLALAGYIAGIFTYFLMFS